MHEVLRDWKLKHMSRLEVALREIVVQCNSLSPADANAACEPLADAARLVRQWQPASLMPARFPRVRTPDACIHAAVVALRNSEGAESGPVFEALVLLTRLPWRVYEAMLGTALHQLRCVSSYWEEARLFRQLRFQFRRAPHCTERIRWIHREVAATPRERWPDLVLLLEHDVPALIDERDAALVLHCLYRYATAWCDGTETSRRRDQTWSVLDIAPPVAHLLADLLVAAGQVTDDDVGGAYALSVLGALDARRMGMLAMQLHWEADDEARGAQVAAVMCQLTHLASRDTALLERWRRANREAVRVQLSANGTPTGTGVHSGLQRVTRYAAMFNSHTRLKP